MGEVTSMIERVARAIAEADPLQQGQINDSEMGEYFWEKYRDHYVVLARAAIEAMREPTDAMIDAGVTADFGHTLGERARNCYQAMIDAALNEQVAG